MQKKQRNKRQRLGTDVTEGGSAKNDGSSESDPEDGAVVLEEQPDLD